MRKLKMNYKKFALAKISGAVLLLVSICSSVVANETVIQKEKMSFKTCLDVITTSEIKLSIAPKITHKGEQKHVAVFKLIDGRLKIDCDGEKGLVTVSTLED